MASGNDAAKNQLMAIYKLEFYKRKENWKLCEDKVANELPETPNKLNNTCNADIPQFDGEQVSPHNKAFLNEEPEDTPDPQPPDVAPPSLNPEELVQSHYWAGQPYMTEPPWQDAQQEWCGAEREVIAEELSVELACERCDGPWYKHNFSAPASDLSLKPAVDLLDYAAQTNEEMLSTAEDWLIRHGFPLLQEEYACSYDGHGLTTESEDFIRGAHEAPHSSEIELNITQECPCTANDTLCVLTVRQMARAIQRHHYALSRLLWEQGIRDGLSVSSRPQPPIPFEEFPTRDTDPLRVPDEVLSGSHRIVSDPCSGLLCPFSGVSGPYSAQPLQATGRGRGRLHQMRQLVGVAMGRPYLI